jgi:bacterioferritin
MNVDPRILGFLHRALSHEMTAVQHYLTQSKLCGMWGMQETCDHFREDVQAELKHAELLIERMMLVGVTPNASQLAPARVGRSFEDMLDINHVLELDAVRIYQEAVSYCERRGEHEFRDFFARIMADEIGHVQELEEMRSKLKQQRA